MEMNGITVINKPVEAVYAYVMDLSNDKNWRAGIDESGWRSDGSTVVGSVGYSRAGNNEIEWRIIDFQEGESIRWELLSGPLAGQGGYRLVNVKGGTEFTLLADIEPQGLVKLLGPLFGWMGRRRNQADVEKLKEILEAG
jgi:uncharacterized membrane protein